MPPQILVVGKSDGEVKLTHEMPAVNNSMMPSLAACGGGLLASVNDKILLLTAGK